MKRRFASGIILGPILLVTALLFCSPLPIAAQVGGVAAHAGDAIAGPPKMATNGATTVPVFRFYFANWQVHMYQTVTNLPGEGWQFEGPAFYVSPLQLPYTVPLYQLYKRLLGDHFYTIDLDGKKYCVGSLGYQDQGVLGYVLPLDKDFPGTAPLYRWVRVGKANGANQDHFYQTSASQPAEYKSEGVACLVWTQRLKLPQHLLELSAPAAGTTLHVNDTPMIGWKVWSGGGFVRISYSADNGSTWQPIATVVNTGNFGDINKQSYNKWKVLAEAAGKIRIKVDWIAATNVGSKLPWATDTSELFAVVNPGIRVQHPGSRNP